MRRPFTLPIAATLALVTALAVASPSGLLEAQRARTGTKFFADDPLMKVADTQDAAKVQPRELSLTYDAQHQSLRTPRAQGRRARRERQHD